MFLALFPIFTLPATLLAQISGLPVDLASLLILLAGPAAAVIASRALDRSAWFRSLDSSGKLLTVGAVTILISAAATGAQQFLIAHPVVNEQLDPYVKAALFALTFVSSQVAYGKRALRDPFTSAIKSEDKTTRVIEVTSRQWNDLVARANLGDLLYVGELKVRDQAADGAEPPTDEAKG